ncbi:unnamed protein product [Ceutorhynchus assimilis]|uniref:Uncharacterized protein n=1 Tax=Ceutorhynchus assimilis TaxID=467358 RepID=A0A9N9MZB1_9CUCU|nr:unnamed protein product [Ceutorhynchus assimilis]
MLETDDDDFTLTPSSTLSAIFEATPEDISPSLSYKAPKQPKAPENSAPKNSEAQSSVILAKVITLWKLNNGKNISMGKYMVAVIGNSTTNLYDIIVYQDKTKILIRLTLGPSLSFFKYPNNFVAFYDANKQLWNINFDDLQAKNEFLDCVTKYDSIVIEQVEKTTSPKEKILSRISKMGQPILPAKTEQIASDSESSLSSDPLPPKPTRKLKRNLGNQLAPVYNENYQHLMSNNNQMMLNNQGSIYPVAHTIPDYGLGSFMIAQNAELKTNLAEINSKLNSVLGNGDKNGNDLKSKIKCQNLKIDNLTSDLNKSRKAFEDLHRKYVELDDQKHMYEAQVATLKEKLLKMEAFENEVEVLKQQILENNKVEELNLKIINYQETINKAELELKDKDKKIEIQNLKLKDFEEYYKETENVKKENVDLKQKLEDLTRKLDKDKSKNDNSWVLDKYIINKLVKEGMNQAYADIMANFEENDEEYYSFGEIQSVLLENLKKTSYTLMNSLSE